MGPTPRACWCYKDTEKRQPWVQPMGGWNSTLQAAWYVRRAHWARLCYRYVPFVIWCCLWITSTTWLLILSSTSFMVGRSRVFYMYSSRKIWVGDSPGCYQGQQDDFTRTMLSITILRTDTIWPAEREGKICMILLHVKQNKTKLSKKCHPYDTKIGSGYISYERQFEWWDEQNRCTYAW